MEVGYTVHFPVFLTNAGGLFDDTKIIHFTFKDKQDLSLKLSGIGHAYRTGKKNHKLDLFHSSIAFP